MKFHRTCWLASMALASLTACTPPLSSPATTLPFAVEQATPFVQMYLTGVPGWAPETPVSIRDFHWGVTEPRPDNAAERPAIATDRREFQEVHFQKDFDTLTPRLMEAAASGRLIDSARFVFSHASATNDPFAECLLENVQIAGVRTPSGTSRGLSDEVFMGFQRLTWKGQTPGAPDVKLGWDLVNKRAIEN